MYKVFVQDKELRIVPRKAKHDRKEGVLLCEDSIPDWPRLKSLLKDRPDGRLIIACSDSKKCWRSLKRKFRIIRAGGGLVINSNDDVLMIKRLGRWDLPKGKLEKGEEILDCSIREVEEECHVFGLTASRTICTTYHVMRRNKNKYLKESKWFLMHTNQTSPGVPQHEEGIDKVKWVKRPDLKKKLKNTWPSIEEVFKRSGVDY